IAALLIEVEQVFRILGGHRPAESSARYGSDDLLGASRLLGWARGFAHEQLLAAGCVGCSLGIERTGHRELSDVREESVSGESTGLDGLAHEVLVEVVARREIGGDEGYSHHVLPGF